MAQQVAERRDVDFVLFEQLGVQDLAKSEPYADFRRKTVELIISEARNLALKELLPTRKVGDEKGCIFDQGKVTVSDEFKRAYELYRQGEWVAPTEDPDWGGQGLPASVAMAVSDYLVGANYGLNIFVGLTHGAGRLIETFGTQEQKEMFLKKLYTGQWAGTMVLTEPEAGSDVGALTTSARRQDDGTYLITGTKIFISGGEQDLTENIIHPVLARIEGAPPGTAGISLFIVPKIWVNPDGSLGETNDVTCVGIEEKMGLHGSPTCQLSFGSKGRCRGLLLGEENKGMREMFLMMNEARLLVGMQGFGCASSAYLEALDYARKRIQGRHILKMADKGAPSVPLIEHPDVRRMLLQMKVHVEGMRSLLYYVGWLEDSKKIAQGQAEQEKCQGLIDVLIPVAKGYVTDRSFEICSLAMQVYGGYGYIKEYPMEQLLRESRIPMIYEGTNGIQAMDLMGRKLGLRNGEAIQDLLQEMEKISRRAAAVDELSLLARPFERALVKFTQILAGVGQALLSGQVMEGFAHAYDLLDTLGDLVMGWMLLWRAFVAFEALQKGAKKKDRAFYQGQILGCEYFMANCLPLTMGRMDVLEALNGAAVKIADLSFGS